MPLPPDALVRVTGNADLGPGRLTGFDDVGRAQVRLIWTSAEVVVDAANGIERYELFPGTPIALRKVGNRDAQQAVITGEIDKPPNGAWAYRIEVSGQAHKGKKRGGATVSEADIEPLPPLTTEPLDHLRSLAWGSPEKFLGRWKLRLIESRYIADSGGIPPLIGARISPMGHQIYAARRILWDRVPRFILADEVGLGKTVEAGLVLQALKAWSPGLRVLVLAPGAMARQWQTELYLRFGALAFSYIDAVTWANVSQAERSRLLKRQHLIVTTTVLQAVPAIRMALKDGDWDMLVIDEAHQFPPGTELYKFFHEMAEQVDGLLALSATPSKREIISLSGLLSLVSPAIYAPDDTEALAQRIKNQRAIWDRLSLTRKALDAARTEGKRLESDDLTYLASEWSGLVTKDLVVEEFLAAMRAGDADAAEQLVAYVQEFHRVDQRIIRTRRSTLESTRQHWSERRVIELTYQPSTAEAVLANHLEMLPPVAEGGNAKVLRGLYFRMFAETPARLLSFLRARQNVLRDAPTLRADDLLSLLSADPSPADEAALVASIVKSAPALADEKRWLDSAVGLVQEWQHAEPICGKVATLGRWLSDHLGRSNVSQVLIFAQDREVVEELCNVLGGLLQSVPIRAFHHGMGEADLAKVALDFQRNRACRVLVSDELGGEGRNFQNADAVVHFDVPWSVARIEQRIGRLDRVGRGSDRPVLSVLCCGSTSVEAALRQIHKEAFKVYTRSVGGLEYALPKLQMVVMEAVCMGAEVLLELSKELQATIEKELAEVDEAFDLSLDASKLQLRDAQELAEILEEPVDDHAEGVALAKWANNLGVVSRKRGKTWEFQWDPDILVRPLEGLPDRHLVEGTFDRNRALADESEQFFGPGHPFVDALLRDLSASGEGRATVLGAQLGDAYVGRCFALILGRCRANNQPLSGKEIAAGLKVRALRFLWPQVEPVLVELQLGKPDPAVVLDDAYLAAMFRGPTTISVPCKLVSANILGGSIDTAELWASLKAAIDLGTRRIVERRRGIPESAAQSLRDDLSPEAGFLKWQRGNASAKVKKQLDLELEARVALVQSLEREHVDVDAVAIIFGVK